MNMKKRPVRLGFAAALLALLLSPLVFGAQSALAQISLPANYWGGGQEAGATISASIDGEECASATVDDNGEWYFQISEGDCNGNAQDGATVNFAINGAAAAETSTWTSGGGGPTALTPAPPEPDDGMDDGMDDGADDGMDDGMDDGADDGMDDGMDDGDGMTPGDKGDTGNAGFATQSGSSSMLLVLALGVLAAAGVAGARTATGRID